MPQRWHKLPRSPNESTPLLLYKFITSPRDYEFYLTDLTYIWCERLKYTQILQKAEEKETSIDPSEDANQFDVFLQKIRDALEGVESSGVEVAPGRKSNSLEVTTTTQLPRGLRALEWTFVLARECPSEVTRHLLLPLLRSEREHQKRERELLDHLADKDKILSKIFDKIDPSQLTDIFPGIAGPRNAKLKTSDLLKHIKGAARFDESEWRKTFPAEGSDGMTAGDITDQTSGILTSSAPKDLQLAGETWWQSLDEDKSSFRKFSRKEKPPVRADLENARNIEQKGLGVDDSTDNEDEFQRQETPPHLKRDKMESSEKPAEVDHDTTESDEEIEPVSKKNRSQPHPQQVKQQPKGLGRIGGPKVSPKFSRSGSLSSTASTASTDTPKSPQIPPAEEETESNISSPPRQRPSISPIPSSPVEKPVAPRRKGGLGKIGGKKPEPMTKAPKDEVTQPANARKAPTQPTKKLGTIGAKKKAPSTDLPSRNIAATREDVTASEDESDDLDSVPKTTQAKPRSKKSPSPKSSPSKSPSPIPKKPPPSSESEEELSAQQKADRKREELKRQLDARSKAPQKKKRKF